MASSGIDNLTHSRPRLRHDRCHSTLSVTIPPAMETRSVNPHSINVCFTIDKLGCGKAGEIFEAKRATSMATYVAAHRDLARYRVCHAMETFPTKGCLSMPLGKQITLCDLDTASNVQPADCGWPIHAFCTAFLIHICRCAHLISIWLRILWQFHGQK